MNQPPLRVLVVEDESLIRWAIRETLAAEGHDVVEAPDAATAMRLLSNPAAPVDIVLLDLRLPDARDLDALARIHRISPGSRVILMSTDMDAATQRRALSCGACGILGKPFDIDHLPELLREVRH